ncbi:MBL fold metallo-hydrolase [Streptomyces sp. DT2A-34]|uniref:MBL fold metallo-hydrolase n=1 Tax=Streptomyces sp. DT2A-34 TaxID=3051182 RepID=UPI00265C828E|nr:MBL fold metallo-hydrolase [Streptomyces sp. DT2A-34]MDO0915345.1 MBL fold metallo-hydrolase [Streptomyces sp. DT2A-34]
MAQAQAHDHGGGVRSIQVPIPDNPLGHTLVYVVDTDRGPVLVDTGWDDPASWDTLTEGLTACGTAPGEIHGVVITHHHPDHHGLSGKVREASGAWIAMHAADAAIVRRTRATRPERWFSYMADKLTAAGAPHAHVAPLRAARRPGTLPGFSPAAPDREIVPGELLDLPGRRLRAIWTPGHTPGHVCLHLEEDHPAQLPGHGRLFSGDHLLPGITPHIGLYEDPEDPDDTTVIDPLGDYLASLERVGRLTPAEILPAHQHAFTDAPARVRELLTHHEERLTGLQALLSDPLTPWQLAERMEWNRPWDQIPYGSRNIAIAEAEAHLRRLVKLGRAEAVAGSEPVTYVAV